MHATNTCHTTVDNMGHPSILLPRSVTSVSGPIPSFPKIAAAPTTIVFFLLLPLLLFLNLLLQNELTPSKVRQHKYFLRKHFEYDHPLLHTYMQTHAHINTHMHARKQTLTRTDTRHKETETQRHRDAQAHTNRSLDSDTET